MKKGIALWAIIGCMLFLVACGEKKEGKEYYEIKVESGLRPEGAEKDQFVLGRQYYQGEAVSILAETVDGGEGEKVIDVYLRPAGKEKQRLLSGISPTYRGRGWYLDEEGRFLIAQSNGVIRLNGEGEVLYNSKTDGNVMDFCRSKDGKVLLLTQKDAEYGLAELDPETGAVTNIDNVLLGKGIWHTGTAETGPMLMNAEGFWRVEPRSGKTELAFSFAGTTYTMKTDKWVEDFRYEDGKVEIIWDSGEVEKLERKALGDEKKIITVRGWSITDRWLREQVNLFNQSNETYYVVFDEPAEGVSRNDFRTQTNLDLGTGSGADIIFENALWGDLHSLLDKGVFADLKPFMEASGISEEDYFPAAFDAWRYQDKIYAVNLEQTVMGYTMERSIAEEAGEITAESLADALLESEEKRFFCGKDVTGSILNFFLCGSEDWWGMIDWEAGTCDFQGGLFEKLLRVSKQYSYDKSYDYPSVMEARLAGDLYGYESDSEMADKNRVMGGYLFDDGCHAKVSSYYVVGINAASENIRGAWELLVFLLGEEAQIARDFGLPVNRNALDRLASQEIEAGARRYSYDDDGKVIGIYKRGDGVDLTQEKVDDLIRFLDEAECLPIRTEPLFDILYEEVHDYFYGDRSIAKVVEMLENRIGLYLQEQKK